MRIALVLVTACWSSPAPTPAPATTTTTSPAPAAPPASAPGARPGPAPLAEAAPAPGHSVWRGLYVCTQGETAVQLTIDVTAGGGADAIFDFGPHAGNPTLPTGSYRLTGAFEDRGTHLEVRFVPDRWILRPSAYEMIGFEAATTDPAQRRMRGTIDSVACGRIDLVRVD